MNKDIEYLMAMSCLLPALVGSFKIKKIEKKYHPFIFMMMLDVAIETIFYVAVKFPNLRRFPQMGVNIYILSNFGLFVYFAYINKYLNKVSLQTFSAIALVIVIINSFYSGTFFATSFYLLCYVSAVMLVISINILSKQIMEISFRLIDNCWFWISSFSTLYNAFNLFIFGLVFFALQNKPNVRSITDIQHFVNVACYMFFAIGIYKMPEKNK